MQCNELLYSLLQCLRLLAQQSLPLVADKQTPRKFETEASTSPMILYFYLVKIYLHYHLPCLLSSLQYAIPQKVQLTPVVSSYKVNFDAILI